MGDATGTLVSERLNAGCFCVSLDDARLRESLSTELGSSEISQLVQERCPFLFSARPVFLSESQQVRMTAAISAIETVIALPAYRKHVLANAPMIAQHDPGGTKGVFFGYDFHVAGDNIGLIEINTNAGGAMLNAVAARAHHACCLNEVQLSAATASAGIFEAGIVAMFQREWQLSNRSSNLRTIAIVDASPSEQYLYPEFLLFQRLFERAGLHAVIADPTELEFRSGALWCRGMSIDLVYNRLTDFKLEGVDVVGLRKAYLANAVVLTPHPQAHALYADKANLALLTDITTLTELGVSQEVQDTLRSIIPHTEIVESSQGLRLWEHRRELFFKPRSGYGGRAAYRGDKITKRVWQDILAGDYVAQAIVVPGQRANGKREMLTPLKFDIRCYAYDGRVQWTAARLYQGQTTNFRTAGGGFAPVYSLPDVEIECCVEACSRNLVT